MEALVKFAELVKNHKDKLFRYLYKEGIITDDNEDYELTEQEKYIIFQYKIFAILDKYLQEALEK